MQVQAKVTFIQTFELVGKTTFIQTFELVGTVLKLIQHRFNFVSTSFNSVERGEKTVSTLLFNKIERIWKPFSRAEMQESTLYEGLCKSRKESTVFTKPHHFRSLSFLSVSGAPVDIATEMSVTQSPYVLSHQHSL